MTKAASGPLHARLVANFGPKVDEDSLLQQLRLQQPDITDLFAAKAPPHSRPALDSALLQRSSLLTLSPTAAGFAGPQQAFQGRRPSRRWAAYRCPRATTRRRTPDGACFVWSGDSPVPR